MREDSCLNRNPLSWVPAHSTTNLNGPRILHVITSSDMCYFIYGKIKRNYTEQKNKIILNKK